MDVCVVVFRKVESRELSPEAVPRHEATDQLVQFTSEAVSGTDFVAADAVVDEQGHFRLPEPPDLSTLVPSVASLVADTAEQLSEVSHVDVETVNKSDTTVL